MLNVNEDLYPVSPSLLLKKILNLEAVRFRICNFDRILPFVFACLIVSRLKDALYGCGTWPVTLREAHGIRVFENRVLRIFGPRREKIT
jgi:hypothetical protein